MSLFLMKTVPKYLRCGPFKNGGSGKAAADSVQQPERVWFWLHQRGIYVQTITHGIMAPCINCVNKHHINCSVFLFFKNNKNVANMRLPKIV